MGNPQYIWLALAVCTAAAGANEEHAVQTFQRLGATITRDNTRPGKPVVAIRFDLSTEETDEHLDMYREMLFWRWWGRGPSADKVTDAELKELKAFPSSNDWTCTGAR